MQSKQGGPVLWGCIGLVCLTGLIAASTSGTAPAYLFTEAPRYSPRAWVNNGERFPAGANIRVTSSTASRKLLEGFAATADPDLSFDATRVLFAGKQKAGDSWRIWEAALENGKPRQITSGDGDCYRPLLSARGSNRVHAPNGYRIAD
jgi:predicted TIM-barrel fold metal-dependent hydrolase